MNRREFFSGAAVAGVGTSLAGTSAAAPPVAAGKPAPVKFTLGCQSGPTDDKRLQFFKRHSVSNICGSVAGGKGRNSYTVDELTRLRERAAKHGVSVDMLWPPFLESSHIDRTDRPAIMLGQSPQRDRDIEAFQTLIKNCAKAGIPAIKYNMSLLGVVRTERTPGRGGVAYSTFQLSKSGKQRDHLTRAGRVTADVYWERITYFLERVIPVANEYKIRMACHPHDPAVPPGFEGVDAVLGSPAGLKKFINIKESPYHGLNFCQGTVSEMLEDPGKEIFDLIRYFGSRQKIFNVHFRNIRGRRHDFHETYPDEGDIDFVHAIRVYKEISYPYMLMPDHVPQHPDDPEGTQAFAFSYGYIRALIQAADALPRVAPT